VREGALIGGGYALKLKFASMADGESRIRRTRSIRQMRETVGWRRLPLRSPLATLG
jgi:hypothetical protein